MDLNTATRPLIRLPFNIIRIALVVGVAMVVLLAKPIATASPVGPTEDGETAAAVRAVTDLSLPVAEQLDSIPRHFAEVQGYRPVEIGGYPVDPEGSCTSPVRLPPAFDAPCQAHDLGYDLLRYAATTGHALGPWARDALDTAFEERLSAACAAESGSALIVCQAAENAAIGAVRFNSWRQNSGVPVPETTMELIFSLVMKVDRA